MKTDFQKVLSKKNNLELISTFVDNPLTWMDGKTLCEKNNKNYNTNAYKANLRELYKHNLLERRHAESNHPRGQSKQEYRFNRDSEASLPLHHLKKYFE